MTLEVEKKRMATFPDPHDPPLSRDGITGIFGRGEEEPSHWRARGTKNPSDPRRRGPLLPETLQEAERAIGKSLNLQGKP